jgi:hypothetical protein
MQYPKYKTGHYNMNGLTVYTEKVTIFIFALIIGYVIFLLTYKLLPFFVSLVDINFYVSTVLTRTELGNPFGLAANVTKPYYSTFYNNFWLPHMVTNKLEKFSLQLNQLDS